MRDTLLESLLASPSTLVILPVQDVFGWTDRINVPATVAPDNWTFMLPWHSDRMTAIPEAGAAQDALRGWCERYGRLP